LALSVRRPSVSGWNGTVTSSTAYLNLYTDGRFDISSYSLTTSSLSGTDDSITIASVKSKDGSTSTTSSQVAVGEDVAGTETWQVKKGINPANMGSYFIDGLTIELRFDDGQLIRKMFAVQGKNSVIFGRTLYWE